MKPLLAALVVGLACLGAAPALRAQLSVQIDSPAPGHVAPLSSCEVAGTLSGLPGPAPVSLVYLRTRYADGTRNANVIEDGSWSASQPGWAYPVVWDELRGQGSFVGRVKWMREGANCVEVYLPGDVPGSPAAERCLTFDFTAGALPPVAVVTHQVQREVDVLDTEGDPGRLAFRLDVINTTAAKTYALDVRADVVLPDGAVVPLELGGPGQAALSLSLAPGDLSHVAMNDPRGLSFSVPVDELSWPVQQGLYRLNTYAWDSAASAPVFGQGNVQYSYRHPGKLLFEERDIVFRVADRSGKPFRDITHLSALGDVQIQGTTQVGAGLAAFDADGDGLTDLFLANPGDDKVRIDSLALLVEHPGGRNWLMRNGGDGSWTDVTLQAGVAGSPDVASIGVAWADVDVDGDIDFVVANRQHRMYLYRNDGAGGFSDLGQSTFGSQPGEQGVVPRFGDIDADGDHDLYLGTSILKWEFDYVHETAPNQMWRNELVEGGFNPSAPGFPSFTDISASSRTGVHATTLAALFFDADRDGALDLAVHPDFGAFLTPNLLFAGNGDGTFSDVSAPAGYEKKEFSMGAVAEDFDGDGDLDVYSTSIGLNGLAWNNGDGSFSHGIHGSGAEGDFLTLGHEADGVNLNENWGPVGFDHDADMDMDLWVAGSYLWTTYQLPIALYHPDSFFINDGAGHFSEAADLLGLANGGRSRGAVLVDVDGDDDLDLVVSRWGEGLTVYRNDVPTSNHSVLLRPVSTLSAPGGFNALVTVTVPGRSQVREVMACSPHAGSLDNLLHFGLGSATSCTVEVQWTSGATTTYFDVPAGGETALFESALDLDGQLDARVRPGQLVELRLHGEPDALVLPCLGLQDDSPARPPALVPGAGLGQPALGLPAAPLRLGPDGQARWRLRVPAVGPAGAVLQLRLVSLDRHGAVRCSSGVSRLTLAP